MTGRGGSGSIGGMDPAIKAELTALLGRMQRVADETYWRFFHAGMGQEAHAFIEFCGVLNKYVDLCARAAEQGIDFRSANTHTGQAMPVADHDMRYLGEKLTCIFGPLIDANPVARQALKEALFGQVDR